jgi:site-specific DNA recombinase
VQVKLSANVRQGRRTRIESGALLGGLIFDQYGNRMSPTYTARRGNRYRYYISRPLTQGRGAARGEEASAVTRVPADVVERLVAEALSGALLRDDLAADTASGTWSLETRNVIR